MTQEGKQCNVPNKLGKAVRKRLAIYVITYAEAAVLGSLLFSCALTGRGGLKRFNCTLESVSRDSFERSSRGDRIMHYEYNKEKGEVALISIKSFNINKSGEESVMNETYKAYEKEGSLLWKRGTVSHFLALSTMKLRDDDVLYSCVIIDE